MTPARSSPPVAHHHSLTVALGILMVAADLTGVARGQLGQLVEFDIPTAASGARGITAGPDGNLWFTEYDANQIGRITPAGVVTEFGVLTAGSGPFGIVAGPDGALWFTQQFASRIGKITTGGSVSEFDGLAASSQPLGITVGPDSALWFTAIGFGKIGRMTTGGALTEFSVGTSALDITSGPDGALWFTENNAQKIGRVTTTGTVSTFDLPGERYPSGIVTGPDGALWFTENSGIGRMTTAGALTEFSTISPGGDLAVGPDGALWLGCGANICRIAVDGSVTSQGAPTAPPSFLTTGPDGHVWFTSPSTNKIGKLILPTTTTTTTTSTTSTTLACLPPPPIARIVNGVPAHDYPSAGALFRVNDAGQIDGWCTGVLVGCETFLTAAHCFCMVGGVHVPASECQGTDLTNPARRMVFFQHAGFFAVSSVKVHPSYQVRSFPSGMLPFLHDIAVLKLAVPTTGIAPSPLAPSSPTPGSAGAIVGFGHTAPPAPGTFGEGIGLKRSGQVEIATCAGRVPSAPEITDTTHVCWDFAAPVGSPGTDSNICTGDSGGPLLVDGAVAAINSVVTNPCGPPSEVFDANVFTDRAWITSEAGADLPDDCGRLVCGDVPAVGSDGTTVLAFDGTLADEPEALHSFGVSPGTTQLRVSLNGTLKDRPDLDLLVRIGSPPTANEHDCLAADVNPLGYCEVTSPASGTWYAAVRRTSGSGDYQLTVTTFSGDQAVCGNNVVENSEACDGTDAGACAAGCDDQCACATCTTGDLSVYKAKLARKFVVGGLLRNRPGLDPRSADFTFTATDGEGDRLQLTIPAGDGGWLWNPRKGLHRWHGYVNGLRVVKLSGGGGTWSLTMKGKNVTGASALGFSGRRYTLVADGSCAAEAPR